MYETSMTTPSTTGINKTNNSNNSNKNTNSESQSQYQACPYLDTITRSFLDFDFEPLCSVSLESSPHVYACLICGQYFRGRGPQTPAYLHAIDTNHAVFIHLQNGTFHCLPDDYEIKIEDEPSLQDIKDALKPTFTNEEIQSLDDIQGSFLARDLFGRRYLPGFVGLNNLKKTDCINATLQALAHVKPLRDFFLRCGDGDIFEVELYNHHLIGTDDDCNISSSNTNNNNNNKKKKKKRRREEDSKMDTQITTDNITKPKTKKTILKIDPSQFTHLAKTFGEILRKMWSKKRFKSTVDPHMFVQAVSVASKKRFTIGKQMEAGEFMAWLLHQLHLGIGGGVIGGKKRKKGTKNNNRNMNVNTSIVQDIFQGVVGITTRQRKQIHEDTSKTKNEEEEDDRIGSEDEEDVKKREESQLLLQKQNNALIEGEDPIVEEITTTSNFLQLTLDIPEKPLFKDEAGGLVIPQEPLVNVLKKFDGTTFHDAISRNGTVQKRRYQLRHLPDCLILHLNRFRKNNFVKEKNPTIVPFPVKNLDLSNYVFRDKKGDDDVPRPTEKEVENMSVRELKDLLQKYERSNLGEHVVEKPELIEICKNFLATSLPDLLSAKYDLVANITHTIPAEVGREGKHDPLEEGSYRCHVQHKGTGQWYEMQDLHVSEIMAQQIGLSESYVLIFEKKRT